MEKYELKQQIITFKIWLLELLGVPEGNPTHLTSSKLTFELPVLKVFKRDLAQVHSKLVLPEVLLDLFKSFAPCPKIRVVGGVSNKNFV